MRADPIATYPCLEQSLAGELGIAVEVVTQARRKHLHRGADWDRVRGRIRLTLGAREQLLDLVKKLGDATPKPANSAPNTATRAPIDGAAESAPDAAEFLHVEAELAKKLGLGQRQLRQVRAGSLKRGADWEMVKGEIRLSEAGLKRLLGILAIPSSTASALAIEPSASVKSATPAAPGARQPGAQENLTCFKCYKINRRMLEATTAAGELVLVRVKDNSNLVPGMAMKCRFAGGRIWELAQRLPRRRGRW